MDAVCATHNASLQVSLALYTIEFNGQGSRILMHTCVLWVSSGASDTWPRRGIVQEFICFIIVLIIAEIADFHTNLPA